MAAMERLLQGMPQRIQDGSLILGISAWHLYPDISVAGSSVLIQQRDGLVRTGGIVTVGIQNRLEGDEGVYWSLPLSHLKYYGRPVIELARAGLGESQITIEELLLVTLGSVFSTWELANTNFEAPVQTIRNLFEMCKVVRHIEPWLQCLALASDKFLNSEGDDRVQMSRLISFGHRRCKDFIAKGQEHPLPVFGLSRVTRMLSLLENTEDKIKLLKRWGAKSDCDLSGALIRCQVVSERQHSFQYMHLLDKDIPSTRKRKLNRSITDYPLRWTDQSSRPEDAEVEYTSEAHAGSKIAEHRVFYMPPTWDYSVERAPFIFLEGNSSAAVFLPAAKAFLAKKCRSTIDHRDISEIITSVLQRCRTEMSPDRPVPISGVLMNWSDELRLNQRNYTRSLQALASATAIYQHLSGAVIELEVTKYPLHLARFSQSACHARAPTRYVSSLKWWENSARVPKLAFSCICYFECVGLDIDQEDFENAIAVCHQNSIFVAQRLLLDPADTNADGPPVRRLVGNVGQLGLAILIPPNAPEIRKTEH